MRRQISLGAFRQQDIPIYLWTKKRRRVVTKDDRAFLFLGDIFAGRVPQPAVHDDY
jgi:hypothetical protein